VATLSAIGFLSTLAFWQFIVDLSAIVVTLEGMSPQQIFAAGGLFLAVSAAGALVASSLSQRRGTRRVLLSALALTLLGSAGTTSAKTLPWLHVGRLVQLLGTSGMWSLCLGTLAHSHEPYEKARRTRAIGLFVAVTALGPASTLMLSELAYRYIHLLRLTHYNYWRAAQGSIAALAGVCWICAYRTLPVPDTRARDDELDAGDHEPVQRSSNPFKTLRLPHVVALSISGGFPLYISNGLLWMQLEFHQRNTTEWQFLFAASAGIATGALLAGFIAGLAASPPHADAPSRSPTTSIAYSFARDAQLGQRPHRSLYTALPGGALVSAALGGVSFILKYDRDIPQGQWRALFLSCIFVAGLGTAVAVVPILVYFTEVAPPGQVASLIAACDALQALLTLPAVATFYALVMFVTVVLLPPLWPLEFNLPAAGLVLFCPLITLVVIRRLKRAVEYPLIADTSGDGASQRE